MVMVLSAPVNASSRSQFEVVAKVSSARRVLPRPARIHELAEDGRENIGKAVEAGVGKRVAASAVLERRPAEAIVGGALLRVLEHVIGFADRLETRFLVAARRYAGRDGIPSPDGGTPP